MKDAYANRCLLCARYERSIYEALSLIMASHVFKNAQKIAASSEIIFDEVETLIQTFHNARMSLEQVNRFLENMANDKSTPDHIVDIVIKFQDQLIKATRALKTDRDALLYEYSDIIESPEP